MNGFSTNIYKLNGEKLFVIADSTLHEVDAYLISSILNEDGVITNESYPIDSSTGKVLQDSFINLGNSKMLNLVAKSGGSILKRYGELFYCLSVDFLTMYEYYQMLADNNVKFSLPYGGENVEMSITIDINYKKECNIKITDSEDCTFSFLKFDLSEKDFDYATMRIASIISSYLAPIYAKSKNVLGKFSIKQGISNYSANIAVYQQNGHT